MSLISSPAAIRPRFHFTPPYGWMNDPNGLVYHQGVYHLFYQYHPNSLIWGPMHWGHAISQDLINWEHLPIALYPDDEGYIFSGSAVIDHANTAGFGANALVAIYTLHYWTNEDRTEQVQCQAIAYSLDNGLNWTKYSGNPVIEMPTDLGHQDFRDPKVFWYGTEKKGHWVMIFTVQDCVWLYTSTDLKQWEKASEFGYDYGCHGGVWECPDLIHMPVEGTDDSRWVLLVSVQDGAPAGGNGVQYFVGQFDGITFTPGETPNVTRWCDYGPDFYAAVTWNNEPHGRHILIGWMNNWPYGNKIPATKWRGMMSVPREMALIPENDVHILTHHPVRELHTIWQSQETKSDSFEIDNQIHMLPQLGSTVTSITISFQLNDSPTADFFGVHLRNNDRHYATIGFDRDANTLYVDRNGAAESVPEMIVSTPHLVPIAADSDELKLTILVDQHSVEVFAQDGRAVISELLFFNDPQVQFHLFAQNGRVQVNGYTYQTI